MVRRDVATRQPGRPGPATTRRTHPTAPERVVSRRDPQRTTGVTTYPPPAVPCGCGHLEAVHEVIANRRRGQCASGGLGGPCTCTRYTPGGER